MKTRATKGSINRLSLAGKVWAKEPMDLIVGTYNVGFSDSFVTLRSCSTMELAVGEGFSKNVSSERRETRGLMAFSMEKSSWATESRSAILETKLAT